MAVSRSLLSLSLSATLAAAVLTVATPAFADTTTFGSYAGIAPAGLSNGAITFDNTGAGAPSTTLKTGTVSFMNEGSQTIAGTTWVSYDPNTSTQGDNGGTTVYGTSYTGNLSGDTGMISLVADDTVAAYLNGAFLGTTAGTPYNTLFTFNIPTGDYVNGLNSFVFDVHNVNGTTVSGGPTGFDFKATAVTPEPNSLMLLGSGMLALAGAARRKLTK